MKSTCSTEASDSRNRNQENSMGLLNRLYYTLKPSIPRAVQLLIRRRLVKIRRKMYPHIWPIDESAAEPPMGWQGWPDNKQFGFVLMHDVDTQVGHDKCRYLMDLEEKVGFRSTFNFVPERYEVSRALMQEVKERGFGIGVHGLKHDGKLFASKYIFLKRAISINHYLNDWGTKGFSTPSMLRNLEWMHALNIEYSTATFDTDPFEPNPEGCRTIFPFWIKEALTENRYLELPYTLPQDFTLFILMGEKDNNIWRLKLNWIASKGGMVLLNTHPDYMNYNNGNNGREEYDASLYREFLEWVKKEYDGLYWHALSRDVAKLCQTGTS